MTAHTPGPYYVNGADIMALRPDGSNLPLSLATVYRPIHYGDERDRQAMSANLRLFAAASETAAERDRLKAINAELLAALKMAVITAGLMREGNPPAVCDWPGLEAAWGATLAKAEPDNA
ncbi:hypothetical protein LCGC14_2925680 [marine sediment metagenome]|uniref:Uncharacterized protein n=1 Tax=marine sediment metagenome TaxID=412755 RepID=A0A0F8XMJ2_9ZZZZ